MRSLSTAKMRSSNLADTMYCHRLSHTQALEQKQSFDPDRNIAFRHVWGWSVPPGKYLCIYDLDGIYSRLGRKSKKEPIWAHLHGSPFKKEGIGVHVFREYTQRSVKTVTYDCIHDVNTKYSSDIPISKKTVTICDCNFESTDAIRIMLVAVRLYTQ